MKVIVLRGSPGSGKSTYTSKIKSEADYEIVSADDFFVVNGIYQFDPKKLFIAHKVCFDKFMKCIDNNKDVIVDNTNAKLSDMKRYVLTGIEASAEVKVITFLCSAETSYKRNKHSVPYVSCEKMVNSINKNLKLPEEWNVLHEVIQTDGRH
jgi:predicted kinase